MERLGIFKRSVGWSIVIPPLLLLLFFAIAAQIGLALIYGEQKDAVGKLGEMSDFRALADSVPARISTVQKDLYSLSILGSIGMKGAEVEEARDRIDQTLKDVALDLRAMAGEIDPAMVAKFERYQRAVNEALLLIERSPVLGTTATRGTQTIYREIREAARLNSEKIAAQNRKALAELRQNWFRLIAASVIASLILMAVLSVLSLMTSRLITRPVLSLAKSVESLENGDVEIVVSGTDRNDELGLVARSVENFRINLIKMFALQAERDELNQNLEEKVRQRTAELHEKSFQLAETQRKANEERLQMTRELEAEFGKVVKAAAAGDFSHHIEVRFSDANIQKLADEVNRMVDTVDAGVSAAAEAIRQLASEGTHNAPEKAFSGAFADMLDNIDETARLIHETSDKLRFNALHDTLTELPNRRYLEERLKGLAASDAAPSTGIFFMHIDLDRFKEVNDTMGHVAGDAVLKHSTMRLSAEAGPDDFVARVGGDEFVIVGPISYNFEKDQPTPEAAERAVEMANRLVSSLAQPFVFEGAEIRHGASVGIAFGHAQKKDVSQLMVDADIALYAAKESGRNQAQLYTPELNSSMMNRKSLADDLRRAVEREEFIPFFQGQFRAKDLQLEGIEALARWDHPTKGILGPFEFLDAAEEIGLLPEIDRQVAQKSVNAAERLFKAGVQFDQLSLNVSMSRLQDPDFIETIRLLQSPNFKLSIELLETIFFDEQTSIFHLLIDALQDMGVQIEIDDFGTGRASITSLLKLNPDRLKIDRSLVQSCDRNPQHLAMVKSIIDMAQALGVGTVAEGIETQETARVMVDAGCDALQGYHFSKPLSEADFRARYAPSAQFIRLAH